MSFQTRGPRGQHTTQLGGGNPFVANLFAILAGLGLGVTLMLELSGIKVSVLTSAGPLLTLLGRVTGMVGTYGMILTLFLVARIPLLEREVGLDRTVRWHRQLAPWSLLLIGLHVAFIIVGYSITEQTSVLGQAWSLVTTTRWILAALAGFALMMLAGITSYKRVRSRMAYETWWVIHVYTYLAVVLAYMHQIILGNAFVNHPLIRNAWLTLTFGAIGCLVGFRWVLPVVRSLRHSLYVHAVVPEGPGVVSIWLGGRDIHNLKAVGGQFFCWRFLTRELWWHAHPYSLSAPPQSEFLRITVKDLGDHSQALANIAPGTRVIAEGPYGAFRADRRNSDRVVLIGGGVGITPIRAVLEDLPANAHVEVLYRAPSDSDVVLQHELDILAQRPRTTVRYLVGSRKDHPMDARTLLRLVPHISSSDIYICGPHALHTQVRHSLEVLGVPDTHIHDEAFAF